ncbi:hypothetical protein ABPG75_008192 [Micractinium tetrahymenae]
MVKVCYLMASSVQVCLGTVARWRCHPAQQAAAAEEVQQGRPGRCSAVLSSLVFYFIANIKSLSWVGRVPGSRAMLSATCSTRAFGHGSRSLVSTTRASLDQQLRPRGPWLTPPCRRPAAPPRHAARLRLRVAAAARDPYELLGVPRSASVSDIKKAFRKRALKLHPDVNKAPDARERFMEAKEAYQQLLDEKEGRAGRGAGGGAGSTRGGTAPGGGASSSWGGYRSGGGSGYEQASSSYQGQQRWQPPEPDYTFGDMLRDLEKELSSYAAERQRKRGPAAGAGAGGAGAPKSLWEELFDIGEEFVEFLEQNLGVSEDEAASYSAFKKEYGDLSGSRNGSSEGTSSSGSGGRAASSSASGRSMADAFGSSSAGSRSGSSSSSSAAPPPPQGKSREQYVEDELAALKRKLGKQ